MDLRVSGHDQEWQMNQFLFMDDIALVADS